MGKKVFWCKKCVVISTRPRVTFNEEGVCSACQWAVEKKTLNWAERQSKLEKLLAEQKSNPHFQCTNAVSGGKDGSYVSYCLKHKKKVRSLAVTVRPVLEQDVGKRTKIG